MGMDVYGKNPATAKGEYFRNNVWWWRPLWNYCESVAPELCADVDGHSNGGDGLDNVGALELAQVLRLEIETGKTELYQEEYRKELSELPRQDCNICNGTGIRTDEIGVQNGQHEKALDPEVVALTGREFGWCNGCNGIGTTPHWATNYPFDVENVREFVDFLADSGGFEIC